MKQLEQSFPGAQVLSFSQLHGGISAVSTLVEIETVAGEKLKLVHRKLGSWSFVGGNAPAELLYHQLEDLLETGLDVPTPVSFSETSVVMTYLEGEPDLAPADLGDYLKKYAEYLAVIHQVCPDSVRGLARDAIGVSDCTGELNLKLGEHEIRRALAQSPSAGANVLRHGDFWPGNVLWKDGSITGVIDWEECMVGDPLADLAICRLDVWFAFGRQAALEFTDFYGSVDDYSLAWWDLWASLRPIREVSRWAAVYPGLGRPDITTESMTRDLREFIDAAFERFEK